MILPSDDSSTPDKKRGKRNPDQPDDAIPEPEFDAEGDASWQSPDLWSSFVDTGFEDSSLMSQQEWRDYLKKELVAAVDDLQNFPDPDTDFDPPDPPDLYTFYAELASMRQELRKSHSETLRKLNKATAAKAAVSSSLAVQLGIIAGELRAQGNDAMAERLLALLDKNA